MAALLVHWCSKLPWSMPKKCNYLRRESRLEFELSFTKRVPLELWCQPKGDLAIQYQKPPMQIQSAMYMYIYTVFAIAVYLGSTYTLIYTWSTNWHNESLCFKMLLGKELCHSCTKTTYQKNNRATKIKNSASPKNFDLSYVIKRWKIIIKKRLNPRMFGDLVAFHSLYIYIYIYYQHISNEITILLGVGKVYLFFE